MSSKEATNYRFNFQMQFKHQALSFKVFIINSLTLIIITITSKGIEPYPFNASLSKRSVLHRNPNIAIQKQASNQNKSQGYTPTLLLWQY
jgi:hypothetical protein